jgi:hypothetical protein
VAENVERLLRLHWAERRVMNSLLAHIASTPEWEVKCAMQSPNGAISAAVTNALLEP